MGAENPKQTRTPPAPRRAGASSFADQRYADLTCTAAVVVRALSVAYILTSSLRSRPAPPPPPRPRALCAQRVAVWHGVELSTFS